MLSFIETEPIDSIEMYEEIENALLESATVVFTSMNAVEAVAAHLNELQTRLENLLHWQHNKKISERIFW